MGEDDLAGHTCSSDNYLSKFGREKHRVRPHLVCGFESYAFKNPIQSLTHLLTDLTKNIHQYKVLSAHHMPATC